MPRWPQRRRYQADRLSLILQIFCIFLLAPLRHHRLPGVTLLSESRRSAPDGDKVLFFQFLILGTQRKSEMPTTIAPPLAVNMSLRSGMTKPGTFHSQIAFGILMLWAVALLSIGAFAHFGSQSSNLTAFEQLALF
jgi:hypothetical protein